MATEDIAQLNIKVKNEGIDSASKSLKALASEARNVESINKKSEESFRKLTEQIKNEMQANERLLVAVKRGASEYQRVKTLIEAENRVRQANIKLTKEQERALIGQIVKTKELEHEIKRLEGSTKTLGSTMKAAFGGTKGLIVGIAAAIATLGAGQILKIADDFGAMQSKIKVALGDSKEFPIVFKEIIDISNRTGTAIEDVAQAFVRLRPATKDLGTSNEKVLQFTESFIKLGLLSGATATEVTNAMIQLSQGLAAGALRGDELRSVMEQMPPLARSIGEAMKIPFSEFKKAAEDGKITAEIVLDALLKKTKEIDIDFSKLPVTVERAFNVIMNGFKQFFGQLLQLSGIQGAITGGMLKFGLALNKAAENVAPLAKGINLGVRVFIEFTKVTLNLINQLNRLILMLMGAGITAFIQLTLAVLRAVGALLSLIPPIARVVDAAKSMASAVWGAITSFDFWISAGESLLIMLARLGAQAEMTTNNISASFRKVSELSATARADIDLANSRAAVKIANNFDAQRTKIKQIGTELRDLAKNGVKAPALGAFGGDGVNTVKPPPAGTAKKAKKDTDANRLKEFIADLDAETNANKRLYAAMQQGESQYDKIKMLIDAEIKVRQANLKITEQQRQAFIKQILMNKQLEQSTEQLTAVYEAQRNADYSAMRFQAYLSNQELGLEQIDLQIALLEKLRQAKIDAASPEGQKIKDAFFEEYWSKKALQNKQDEDALKRQIDMQMELNKSIGLSERDYEEVKARLQDIEEIRKKGITLGSIESDRILADNALLREQQRLREDTIKRNEQLREINNSQRLYDARSQGGEFDFKRNEVVFKAYEEMVKLIERENQVISEGLILTDARGQARLKELESLQQQAQAMDEMIKRQEHMRDLAKEVGDSFSDAFESAIFGANSLKDSLRQLSLQLGKMLYRETLGKYISGGLQTILGAATGGAGGALMGHSIGAGLGFAKGGVLAGGNVIPFARGGITNQPTMFPMAGGKSGLMGEAGPEAIMPLTRLANGKLGVAAMGAGANGGNGVVISTPINITVQSGAGGDDKDRQDLAGRISKELEKTLDAKIVAQIRNQQRPGNLLNRGSTLKS